MYNLNKSYQEKYLKYKNKYLKLKKLVGGVVQEPASVSEIKILVITFNQGHQSDINVASLDTLINNNNPDLVAIALQESTMITLFKIFKFNNYKRIINDSMSQGTLGFMHLCIYKNNKSAINITHTKSSSRCSTSLKDTSGIFKGGIIAYLTINPTDKPTQSTNLAIVCSHLPSDPDKPEKRDECLNKLITKNKNNIIFTGDLNYRTTKIKDPSSVAKTTMANRCLCDSATGIASSLDNFISNQSKESKESKNKLSTDTNTSEYDKDKQTLPDYKVADQLTTNLNTTLKATELKESDINFCPTCKLKLQKKVARTKEETNYNDERFPSWCDRVLYKGDKLKPEKYDSINLSNHSDHLAVYQIFTLSFN